MRVRNLGRGDTEVKFPSQTPRRGLTQDLQRLVRKSHSFLCCAHRFHQTGRDFEHKNPLGHTRRL